MSDNTEELSGLVALRKDILNRGVPLADLDEYQVLTLRLAEAAPGLLRVINDVIALRDELAADNGAASVVAHGFATEIDRLLKGQRS